MSATLAPVGASVVAGIVAALILPHEDGHPFVECFPEVGTLDKDGNGVVAIPPGTMVKIDETTSLPVAVGMTFDGEAFGPAPPPPPAVAHPRTASTYQLMRAFTDAQRSAYPTAVKPWDQRLFSARDTAWPEGNEKIARIATALGTTPAAWFDAALTRAG